VVLIQLQLKDLHAKEMGKQVNMFVVNALFYMMLAIQSEQD